MQQNNESETKQILSPSMGTAKSEINPAYEDEIDLVDLVSVLWRRRWLMVAITVVIVGLAVAYCFIATPQYEISAQLSPGITGFDKQTGNTIRNGTAVDLKNWFDQEGYLDALIGILGQDAALPEIEAGTARQSNVVNVSFDWPEPEQGKQQLQSVIDFLSQSGRGSIQQLIGSQRTIKQRIFKLEKDKEHISIERERLTDNVQKTQQKLAVDQQTL